MLAWIKAQFTIINRIKITAKLRTLAINLKKNDVYMSMEKTHLDNKV